MKAGIRKIVCLVLGVIMIAGVLPWSLVRLGNMWFADNPAQARLAWTGAQFTSFYERDVVLYDIANSYLAERNHDAAISSYAAADAIGTAKTRCPNRYNWGLTLMQKGDASAQRNSARAAYTEGLRVISINDCQNNPQYKARFDALYAELLKRLKAVNEQPDEKESSEDSADRQKAEELAKDDTQEKTAAKDFQNQRRFDSSQEDRTPGEYKFVW